MHSLKLNSSKLKYEKTLKILEIQKNIYKQIKSKLKIYQKIKYQQHQHFPFFLKKLKVFIIIFEFLILKIKKIEQMQSTIESALFNLSCEDFYSKIVSNPQLLSNGYELVYKYLSISSNNRQNTLLNLLNQNVPVLTLVTRTYPIVFADQSVGITIQERLKTKQFLIIEILLKRLIFNFNKQKYENKKNLTNFLLFLIHFHNNQGFQDWVVFYEKLLEELIKMNSQLIGFVLIEILKNSDDRVSCFSKHILSFVINNQSNLKISQEQSIQIIYYCIKSMAYLNGTDDQVLQQFVEPYQKKITDYIFASISKSIKIMKFSLKILTVFASDYQIDLQKEMINKIKDCSKQLAAQFIQTRILNTESFDQDEDQQSNNTISVIIYQLLELFSALLSSQQMKMSDYQIYLSLCLPSLLLSKSQYIDYNKSTELYLADIEDQAQKTLRNKAISFLLQLYQGQFPSKIKGKMQQQLLKYSLLINVDIQQHGQDKFAQQLIKFFSKIGLSTITLQKQHIYLFQQSIVYLLYHLIQQILASQAKSLEQNKQGLMISLGKFIQSSNNSLNNSLNNSQHNNNSPLIKVSYLNLLNKIIKSMNQNVKRSFYDFLIGELHKIIDFDKEKGFLLAVCRGIAYVANQVQIDFTDKNQARKIPIIIIQHLIKYLLDADTLQQSAHLVLQFFLTLLKKGKNCNEIFKSLISSQIQIHVLTNFIHDGMVADVVIDLLGEIANEEFVKYIFGQFIKGSAKQQNLAGLIAKWVKFSIVQPTQSDIKALLHSYKNSFVCKIIKEYLRTIKTKNTAQNLSSQIIAVLNEKIHSSWILPMIKCNILRNPELLLISTIQNITYTLTSQYQIQSQLLLPFYTFLNDPSFGSNLIKSKSGQLYQAFITKIIRYAALFQGPYLKVITSLVLLNISEIDHSKIQSVLELISSFGNSMQGEEWEDQNQNQKDQLSVMDRMFNLKFVNDDVQAQFAQIFGNKVTDMEIVNQKVSKLALLIKLS